VTTFAEFVLAQLTPPPGRVLEVGCGEEGGIAHSLVGAGYTVLAIDPVAPAGPPFRRVTLEELDDPGPFDAAVAGRVLHHVHPLDAALDKLARLAPLLLVDEFSWEKIDEPAQRWYEDQYRTLRAAGIEPKGPSDLDEWRWRHPGLHPSDLLLAELDTRFETRVLERRPYFYRWLRSAGIEQLEASLIVAGELPAIGLRYAGVARTETVRSSAAPR
jgi:hypothetical protein